MRLPYAQVSFISLLVACALLSSGARVALAEVSEVRVAQQFGVSYLPLMVMRRGKLIEKHAGRMGVTPLKVTWRTFGSGADMNVALISQTLDFASGGVAPVLQVWERTKGNLAVKGVAALGSLPLYLNTISAKIRTIPGFHGKRQNCIARGEGINSGSAAADGCK